MTRTAGGVVLLCVLAFSASAVAGTAAGTVAVDDDPAGPSEREAVDALSAVVEEDEDDNETVRHRDPDGQYADEDEMLDSWLTEQLGSQLEEGAIQIGEGEAERARELVGDEFADRHAQYVEVADDEDEDDDEAESFGGAGEEFQNVSAAIAAYEDALERYETARDADEDERAREVARELEELATEVDEASRELREQYAALDELVGADLQEAAAAIEERNREIQAEQAEIREAEFDETALQIEADSEAISFVDPLEASGRLLTADGEPVADESITLEIGNRTLSTDTDANGGFEFSYRPVSIAETAESVSVSYEPDEESPYLGSETNVSVSVEQVEPTIADPTVEPDEVTPGEPLSVSTELTVDGEPVDGAPLLVTLDDEPLGSLETENGSFNGTATVPPTVADGEAELRVEVPFEDRALAETATATTVSVTAADPELSITAVRDGERDVAVEGTLTAAGEGVDDAPIDIVVGGTTVETVTTDEDGSFNASVTVADGMADGDVDVVAAYDGTGTSLDGVEARSSVTFPTASSGVPTWVWLSIGWALALVAAVGSWALARRYRRREGGAAAPGSVDDDAGRERSGDARRHAPVASGALLSAATDHLARGRPEAAVSAAYAATRSEVGSRIDAREPVTHWELYRQYRERIGDDELFQAVTEGYERATFDPEPVTRSDAERVLDCAQRLCTGDT
ncbi:hypothetical protein [Halovivax sp.]|uniref:hypothetical protein n=1 Tax=Halovivax sp. TaxID=1935978 RepID=UPI0025BCE315|nr:hypothetical protein [Halovivax sp.]